MLNFLNLLFLLFYIIPFIAISQKDTIIKELDPVIVTASRTLRHTDSIAVPVKIISWREINHGGSLRLNNVLEEQTGLFMTNASGYGVQMEGMDPAYTMIMINGEPIIGRNSGVLDLSRISVSNVQQIEIVSGPTSSLYGSEAMAGVINIITDTSHNPEGYISSRYGSNGKNDANFNIANGTQRNNWNFHLNRYGSSGYKINSSDAAMTENPFISYTAELKTEQKFSDSFHWTNSLRYYNSKIHTNPYKSTDSNNNPEIISGKENTEEYNIHEGIYYKILKQLESRIHMYYTQYKNQTLDQYKYDTGSTYFNDYFRQRLLRTEVQFNWNIAFNTTLTSGFGADADGVMTTRYDSSNMRERREKAVFFYSQTEWMVRKGWIIVPGIRFDKNETYKSSISPKLAIRKNLPMGLYLMASVGKAFKAPDFRQKYLNFTNTTPGTGYTVLGNNNLQSIVNYMEAQGLIEEVLIAPDKLGELKPETSLSLHLSAGYHFSNNGRIEITAFSNRIHQMIETIPIAIKKNGAYVYSYQNIDRAYTKGIKIDFSINPFKNLMLRLGYQLLFTGNQADLDAIKNGTIYGRIGKSIYKVTTKDYWGLINRSRHMLNFNLFYENKNWFFNIKNLYRGKWPIKDLDGNAIINKGDQFASGYLKTNISAGINFIKKISIQSGIDNLWGYRDATNLPELPGRTYYVQLKYLFPISFILKTHKQK